MFAAAVLLATLPAPPHLADLDAFRANGITRDVAALNRTATVRHLQKVVDRIPEDWGRWVWEQRQAGVAECWRALAEALDDGEPANVRAQRLSELRNRIGDAAYFGGRMPSPVPCYQSPPNPPVRRPR